MSKPSLQLLVNTGIVDVTMSAFPAGETHVVIHGDHVDAPQERVDATIVLHFNSNSDLIDLLLLTDAVRRRWPSPTTSVTLFCEYLPYARQDRVCNPGESLSIKVIADLLNSQKYDEVVCLDLHSDVSGALINNLYHAQLPELLLQMPKETSGAILVAPDAGSVKKVMEVAKTYAIADVVMASKMRNTLTGEITGTTVYSGPVGDRDFLILDDICDGGRTFIELAKVLRKLTTGKIMLYVTHGIFSKGAGVFEGVIDHIYTSNLMGEPHPLVTEI